MNGAYLYWVVQYVPDVVRDERVNVAIIAGRDGGDWAVRVAPDLRRASRLGGDASALRPWLAQLEQTIRDFEHPPLGLFADGETARVSQAWLELLAHRFNNVLQISAAAPVAATSARESVDFLYPVLVATPEPMKRSRTRQRIVQDLAHLYERTAGLEIGGNVLQRPIATIGSQKRRFDYAVVDGEVDQVSHVFAFDVRDAEILERDVQAWNFIVGRIREDGALIMHGDVTHHAADTVPIAVAYQEPRDGDPHHREVFDAAQEAWAGLGVEAVPSTELDRIALDAQALVAA